MSRYPSPVYSVGSLLLLSMGICLGLSVERAQARQTPPPSTRPPAEAHAPKQDGDTEPATVAKLKRQATAAYNQGDYPTAVTLAARICKLEPNQIRSQLLLGEISFAAGEMDRCIAAYDAAIALDPAIEPQLWQRGLALYYADRFADGVAQFETHQTVNSQDVENAVWHLLCAARVADLAQARKKLIPITGDTRVPMSQIYEMFAGRMTPEAVLKTANQTSSRVPADSQQQKLQLYYAHLYIGLYQEMLGQPELASQSLESATAVNPLGKTNFMGQVARVHLDCRKPANQ